VTTDAPDPPKTPLLRKAIALEAGIWRSLHDWARRRTVDAHDGDLTFGYTAAAAPLLWVFIVMSAIEIPLVDLVLPWAAVRVAFLILGAWGLLWMFGLLASMHVHPHVAGPSGLRVRSGLTVDITVPWESIAAVRTHLRTLPKTQTMQLEQEGSNAVLHVTVSSMTNVHVELRQPISVPVAKIGSTPITVLRCYADDPVAFVTKAQDFLTPATTEPGTATT
jgi:hypothetical protein